MVTMRTTPPPRSLLVALHAEPIPAGLVEESGEYWKEAWAQKLRERGYRVEEARPFATPHHLGAFLSFTEKEATSSSWVRGPSEAQAWEGDPAGWSAAAHAWAKKVGIALESAEWVEQKGRRYLTAQVSPRAEPLERLIPTWMEEILRGFKFPRWLRWDRREHALMFIRPLRHLIALLDDQPVQGRVGVLPLGATLPLPEGPLSQAKPLQRAEDYERFLRAEGFEPIFKEREALLRAQLKAALDPGDRLASGQEALIQELCGSVEAPWVWRAPLHRLAFQLPQAAVQQMLNKDLRSFSIEQEGGNQAPYFMGVADRAAQALTRAFRQEVPERFAWVAEARLKDLHFFYQRDLKDSFKVWSRNLTQLMVHERLGTMADKQNRLERFVARLSEQLPVSREAVVQAAAWSKVDLGSQMVVEMPELAGVMGAHYARLLGMPEAICFAIEKHGQPIKAPSEYSSSSVVFSLALAHHTDHLVGMMGIGVRPQATKDPFGIRRSALSLLHLLLGAEEALALPDLLDWSAATFPEGALDPKGVSDASHFLEQRLEGLCLAAGDAPEMVRALIRRHQGRMIPSSLQVQLSVIRTLRDSEAGKRVQKVVKRIRGLISSDDFRASSLALSGAELWHPLAKLCGQEVSQMVPLAWEQAPKALQAQAEEHWKRVLKLLPSLEQWLDSEKLTELPEMQRASSLALLSQCLEKMSECIPWEG